MNDGLGKFDLHDTGAFRGVIDAVPHPIFVKDEETRFIIMNEMMCQLMGRRFEDLVGRQDLDFFPRDQADVFRGNDLRVLNTGEVNENEELFSDGDGNVRTIVTRKKRLVLSNGTRLLVGCITDISDFRRAEALIRHHADHDPLTGLANRRVFCEEISQAVSRVDRSGAAYSVILLDLDRFKPVNDVYGHTVGDAVLCEIATRLRSVIRKGDLVARLGGDEFGIVTETNPASEAQADGIIKLASRVMTAVERPIDVGATQISVGASLGVARCGPDGQNAEALLRAADVAMYRAKEEGRGDFRFFERQMDDDIRNRAALEADLRTAVSSGQIVPYYQPLIGLADNGLVGFEILARWDHPTKGPIAPDVFVPLAERTGLISELTFSLLGSACSDAKDWPASCTLSLNLSPLQLKDRLLPLQILSLLSKAGFPPQRLEIEVTESALIADMEAAKDVIAAFQDLGIKVSLDDFGTGYSSMHHLRELRFDKIKIDRSFILSMRDNPESDKIVNAILGLTKSLGLPTIAEGVEDAELLAIMIEKGCDFGQGFFFGKAIPGHEVADLMKTHYSERGTRKASKSRRSK